jgi:hypothetical protein
MYDVFISYRRKGGADFAQLLKLMLRAEGLDVFLDVENLGMGNFETQLEHSLQQSRNVVVVWSRGCLDRMLGGACTAEQDFVRQEYAHALRLGKNMVPVYKEDFVVPDAERMPADVRGVLAMNAIKWVAEYRDASFRKLMDTMQLAD